MPIPMRVPAEYLAKLASGELVRYGAIIKDASSGHIVGHLKEAGRLGDWMSGLDISPFSIASKVNPVSMITDIANLGVNVSNAWQLKMVKDQVIQLREALEGMQLATNVAALASIAGLGVSVDGFTAVNKRLERMESKLDAMAGDIAIIKKMLGEIHVSWQAMSMAKLEKAADTLMIAEKATEATRRMELVKEAVSEFALLKSYYANLLKRPGLFEDLSLSVDDMYELIARYTFCCMGVLHGEFRIGDLGAYRSRLEKILSEYDSVVTFSPKAVYQARCDNMQPLALGANFDELSTSLQQLNRYVGESVARVESFEVELLYIEGNKLSAEQYLNALQEVDTGLYVLPVPQSPETFFDQAGEFQ